MLLVIKKVIDYKTKLHITENRENIIKKRIVQLDMILTKIFDENVTTHTPLGSIDLSGYSCYSVLLRVDNATSNTQPFRFTTYNNNIQAYQHEFSATNGWHTHNVVHDIFSPTFSFVLYN